jgi:hypothetical protein
MIVAINWSASITKDYILQYSKQQHHQLESLLRENEYQQAVLAKKMAALEKKQAAHKKRQCKKHCLFRFARAG